jgi:hypothetical protein
MAPPWGNEQLPPILAATFTKILRPCATHNGNEMTGEMLIWIHELHSRVNDGIRARMLWCQESGRLFVAVNDHRSGDALSVEAPEDERPLQVSSHPYAYAA